MCEHVSTSSTNICSEHARDFHRGGGKTDPRTLKKKEISRSNPRDLFFFRLSIVYRVTKGSVPQEEKVVLFEVNIDTSVLEILENPPQTSVET